MYDNLSEHIRSVISFNKAPSVNEPENHYTGFKPGSEIMKKGFRKDETHMALERDIIYERDVPVVLRDGVTIYIDVYRPVTEEKVPALLASSMFGKQIDGPGSITHFPDNAGVKDEWVSGYQSWEALDPFYWCNHGYAIVYMDVRGTQMSEGDACYFGSQDAQDNYDTIEFLGTRDWCNGKVSMGGNSWLAITQWYVAALNPPHLGAIAPWEGHGNMYGDEYVPGGIPNLGGTRHSISYGLNRQEDLRAMIRRFPFMNEYWDDKYAKFEKITAPAYVVASYSAMHSHGTFEGFRKMSSKDKWLRVHNKQEWEDLYTPENAADLLKFFDHFLKGIDNGWEKTPRVRLTILNAGDVSKDIVGRPEEDFPLKRNQNKRFYLNAGDGSLSEEKPECVSTVDYNSDPAVKVMLPKVPRHQKKLITEVAKIDPKDPGVVIFSHTFDEETEVCGYAKLKVWMQAEGRNDMDVYVRMTKLDKDGNPLYHWSTIGNFAGPAGRLRASLRALDDEFSTENEPVHPFNSPAYLEPEDIVPLEIGLCPTGMLFQKGEKLSVSVAGYDYLGSVPHFAESVYFNSGIHRIYTGGKYDSVLVVPVTQES